MAKQLIKILDNGVSLSLEGEEDEDLYELELDGNKYLVHHLNLSNNSRTDNNPDSGDIRVKIAYKLVRLESTYGIYGKASVINDSSILDRLSLEYQHQLDIIELPFEE